MGGRSFWGRPPSRTFHQVISTALHEWDAGAAILSDRKCHQERRPRCCAAASGGCASAVRMRFIECAGAAASTCLDRPGWQLRWSASCWLCRG